MELFSSPRSVFVQGDSYAFVIDRGFSTTRTKVTDRRPVGYLEYYDKLLVAIGASLALGVAIGTVTSVPFIAGVAAGAAFATIFVYEAMFRNPPLPPDSIEMKAAAIVWHAFLAVVVVAALV